MARTVFLAVLLSPAAVQGAISEERVKAALPQLEKLAQQALKRTGVPGLAIAIVHNDRVVYLRGFGVREVGSAAPVGPDTVFPLASLSKPITSTILAALVGAGTMRFDDRMIDLDPTFLLGDPWVTRTVTPADLLSHRSGLPSFIGDDLLDLGYDGAQVLHRLRHVPLATSFRTQWAYTNSAFSAPAFAAARVAGKSWPDLAAEKLFRPLGMKSTSFRSADYRAAADRARIHARAGGKWVVSEYNVDALAPAGGASSTARDLSRWLRLQLASGKLEGKQLIAAEALAQTHRPHILLSFDPKTHRATFYALGWEAYTDEQGRAILTHNGAWISGVRTEAVLLPAQRLGIAVLVNAFPSGLPEALRECFFDLVLKGKVEKDHVGEWNKRYEDLPNLYRVHGLGLKTDYTRPPARPLPPLPLPAYVGSYPNSFYGDLEVVRKDGGLEVRLGPAKKAYALRHFDRDVFFYEPKGESAFGPTGVLFRVGPDRQVTHAVVELFRMSGAGPFGPRRPLPASPR
jgi:CubicO group peptidase (beta-lactamase class C family)